MSTRDTWCKHRTSFTTDIKVCKIGVDFHQFQQFGGIHEMPCLGETETSRSRCPQYDAWTAEEIAAREAEFRSGLERMGIIRRAIVTSVQLTGARSGQMQCPCCESGTVAYSQASNGHVHAKCSTDGCAGWME